MTSGHTRSLAERSYDVALTLYPRDFRDRFADEMRAFVREREAEALLASGQPGPGRGGP